jgi:hypothetical protein
MSIKLASRLTADPYTSGLLGNDDGIDGLLQIEYGTTETELWPESVYTVIREPRVGGVWRLQSLLVPTSNGDLTLTFYYDEFSGGNEIGSVTVPSANLVGDFDGVALEIQATILSRWFTPPALKITCFGHVIAPDGTVFPIVPDPYEPFIPGEASQIIVTAVSTSNEDNALLFYAGMEQLN